MVTYTQPLDTHEQGDSDGWLTAAWLEPRLVVVTLVAILLSAVSEAQGAPAWLTLLFNLISYAAGGVFGVKTAIESLLERKIDVDMLMVLAALGAAFVGQWREGATLLFLFSLSNVLQDYAIGRSRSAIKSLLKLYPEEAKVHRDGETATVRLEDLRVGDVVLIEPGERIPVDGVVKAGRSAVDQSPITGESIPVDKLPGDAVFAGTLNQQGILDVEVTKLSSESTLARIIKLVEDAQENKAPTERFLETFEQRYAAAILLGVALFIVVPPLLGIIDDFGAHFYRAMVLMTVASPCALVISVPASFIAAIASAARGGVLFKGGKALEDLARIKAVAFDKTGTLTQGKPSVTDVLSCCALGENDLLSVAAAVESRSEHPLAQAILNAAAARGLKLGAVEDFEAIPGRGIVSTVDGKEVRLGSIKYLTERSPMPPQMHAQYEKFESEGKTVVGVIRQGQCAGCGECDFGRTDCDWMGVIAVADQVRPEAAAVISNLRRRGVEVAMLTGDNERVARAIAAQVGISRVHADLLPEDKVNVVRDLKATLGAVAMIGDGVNDAPALATANVGVAMGAAGTDAALETADVVLMGDRLERLIDVLDLSLRARRVVWQNIIFALAVIGVLVTSVFAVNLPLPLGVLGHEGSTVIVVLNGLLSLLIVPEIRRRLKEREATRRQMQAA
jgi:Cd2+/Zn2+-exporting ATPase